MAVAVNLVIYDHVNDFGTARDSLASSRAYPCSSSFIRVYALLHHRVASFGLSFIAFVYSSAAPLK